MGATCGWFFAALGRSCRRTGHVGIEVPARHAPTGTSARYRMQVDARLLRRVANRRRRHDPAAFHCRCGGGRSGGFLDMRTMVCLYTAPDAGPYGWDLARHYRIPTFTVACTDAKIFDAQAAGETALTLFENTLNGANLIHDLGYLDSAMTGSLELVVYSDEVIEWIKRYWHPFELTEESLALDLIHATGPDGHFLETDHRHRIVQARLHQGVGQL